MKQSEFFFALITSPFQAVHSVAYRKRLNVGDKHAGVVAYYIGFCALFSLLSMAYVFSSFEDAGAVCALSNTQVALRRVLRFRESG